MNIEEFRTLDIEDTVKIECLEALKLCPSVSVEMYRYADMEAKVVGMSHDIINTSSPEIYLDLPNGRGYYWRHTDIAKIISRAEVIQPKEVSYKESYNVEINGANKRGYSLCDFSIIRICDSVKKIIRCGNSKKFAEIIAGKWVILCESNNRLYNNLNPHIEELLENVGIVDWRIDDLYRLYTDRKSLYEDSKREWADFSIDFKNGKFKMKKVAGNRCPICGSMLDAENTVGKYCKNCLITNEGFAYRFGYHRFHEPYTIPNVDTTKVPIFGCEIERDYYDDGDYCEGFDEDMPNACVEILKNMQGRELKNGTLKRENVFMSDGSLNNGGIEWITYPHTFDWYVKNKDKINDALSAIKKYGFCSSERVGNHIHINRSFFINKKGINQSLYCASKIAVILNKYWDNFVLLANREDTEYARKPDQNYEDDPFVIVEKTQDKIEEHEVAVNLQHSRTIEIRLWGGIECAEDLLFFLDNTQALARYVKNNSLEKVQKCKFTDYMKYFKLKSSLEIAKNRLNFTYCSKYVKEIQTLINKKKKGVK